MRKVQLRGTPPRGIDNFTSKEGDGSVVIVAQLHFFEGVLGAIEFPKAYSVGRLSDGFIFIEDADPL